MNGDVTVVIPTVTGRARLLGAAVASVAAQTCPPEATHVTHDVRREGPAAARNRGVQAASTTWVAFLDDDDVMLPGHLQTLLEHADDGDVIYTRGEIVGRDGWDPQRFPFPYYRMRRVNSLPVTVLARRQLVLDVGGFPDHQVAPNGYEDWGLWLRLMDAGATFVGVDVVTWQYRFDADRRQRSWRDL